MTPRSFFPNRAHCFKTLTVCVATALSVGCTSIVDSDPDEKVGAVDQAVQNGLADTTDMFPFVVSLVKTDKSEPFCSGSLITPYWIMSARHCFTEGGPPGLNDDFDVLFGVDPTTADDYHRFPHSFGTSGAVLIRGSGSVDIEDDEDIAEDIAVFRLDKRVPRAIAKPRHPPMSPQTCPSGDFDGTIVGYGKGFGVCSDPPTRRRYGTDSGWERSNEDTGSVYRNHWQTLFQICDEYAGTTSGDSGGPLLDANGNICAVSSTIPFPVPVFIPPGFTGLLFANVNAGIDTSKTIDFLNDATSDLGYHVIDPRGYFDGECPAYLAKCDAWGGLDICTILEKQDADDDGVIDICDNCPTVYNPEQVTVGDDPKKTGNGHGAACDFCPELAYSGGPGPADNCNYEAELANAYDNGLAAPPVLGKPADTPIAKYMFQKAKEKYLNAFRPDVCDAVTCPRQSMGSSQGPGLPPYMLPQTKACSEGNPELIPGCNCPLPTLSCAWQVSPNLLQLSAQTHDYAQFWPEGQHVGDNVKMGLRWCNCATDTSTDTIAGRAICFKKCGVSKDSYLGGYPWFSMVTEAPAGWPAFEQGAEFAMGVLKLYSGDVLESARWNFQQLPGIYVKESKAQIDLGGIIAKSAHGVILAKVVEANGDGVASTRPLFDEFAQTFQSGNASIELQDTFDWSPFPGEFDPNLYTEIFCPNCPDPYALTASTPDDPNFYKITGEGVELVHAVPPGLAELHTLFHAGSRIHVPAAEMLADLQATAKSGEPLLRGVALDPVTPHVTHVLESAGMDVSPGLGSRGPCLECSPKLMGNEALLLSGSQRRLLVIGGTMNGKKNGGVNKSAWLLDVDTNTWSEQHLPKGQRPGAVVAATSRPCSATSMLPFGRQRICGGW